MEDLVFVVMTKIISQNFKSFINHLISPAASLPCFSTSFFIYININVIHGFQIVVICIIFLKLCPDMPYVIYLLLALDSPHLIVRILYKHQIPVQHIGKNSTNYCEKLQCRRNAYSKYFIKSYDCYLLHLNCHRKIENILSQYI